MYRVTIYLSGRRSYAAKYSTIDECLRFIEDRLKRANKHIIDPDDVTLISIDEIGKAEQCQPSFCQYLP